jgi:uncharacterized spore protein YtfJ
MSDPTGESELRQYVPQTSFLERLADRLELGSNARAIFGAPIEREGTTVIPVAKARWGMGGGWGTKRDPSDAPTRRSGTGGGGGAIVKPLGFIELANGEAKFRPIRDPAVTAITVIAGGLLGLSALGMVTGPRARKMRSFLRIARRRRRIARLRRFFR